MHLTKKRTILIVLKLFASLLTWITRPTNASPLTNKGAHHHRLTSFIHTATLQVSLQEYIYFGTVNAKAAA